MFSGRRCSAIRPLTTKESPACDRERSRSTSLCGSWLLATTSRTVPTASTSATAETKTSSIALRLKEQRADRRAGELTLRRRTRAHRSRRSGRRSRRRRGSRRARPPVRPRSRERARAATSNPVRSGSWTSSRTISGWSSAASCERLGPVLRLADDREPVALEQRPRGRPEARMVVDDEHGLRHALHRRRARARRGYTGTRTSGERVCGYWSRRNDGTSSSSLDGS